MEYHLCLLLYSKYSNFSKQLFDGINNAPINLYNLININTICIDHEEIRNRIIKDNKIEITHVPCILLIYNSGTVEKYEGMQAFEWIESIINKHYQPPPPPPPPHPPPPPPPPQQIKQQEIVDYDDEEDVLSQKVKQKKRKQKIVNTDNDETILISKPPVAIRNGAGDYNIVDEFGEDPVPNHNVSKHIRSSTSAVTGGGDLMSTAMAMQKEREKIATPQR